MPSRAQLVRSLTPPLVWNYCKRNLPFLVRRMGGNYTHIRFTGDYASYDAAKSASTGYDARAILEKTREALLKVKNGVNRWEQDAMVSDSDELPWALVSALLRCALVQGRRDLHVLDFGGSLGSTYYWCRPYLLSALQGLRWDIIEQPGHVAVGRADFENNELKFFETPEQAIRAAKPDVLLISGVLHYLPDPEAFLEGLLRLKVPHFILDRTPLWSEDRHRLTIQHVPAEIYEASYPAWFLSERRILDLIGKYYTTINRAECAEAWEVDAHVVSSVRWEFQLKETHA